MPTSTNTEQSSSKLAYVQGLRTKRVATHRQQCSVRVADCLLQLWDGSANCPLHSRNIFQVILDRIKRCPQLFHCLRTTEING
jgi:hypothetical protein